MVFTGAACWAAGAAVSSFAWLFEVQASAANINPAAAIKEKSFIGFMFFVF